MRSILVLLPIIVSVFSFNGCSIFASDDWKEEYGTPELFFENTYGDKYVYMYENEGQYKDEDLEILNAMKESGPFEETSKKEATSDRYFTYQGYWTPATSGPNYCYLSIWDDGFVRIHHKQSLGPHSYLYFTMDSDKAKSLTDMVFEKVSYAEDIRNADEAQAKIDGSIENFLTMIEKKNSVACSIVLKEGIMYNTYSFIDYKEIFEILKNTTYTPVDSLKDDVFFFYNTSQDWTLELWGTSRVRIQYHYTNKLDEYRGVALFYEVDSSVGQSILDLAAQKAKE